MRTKFKEITEAYSILSDERKRREYDAYGQAFPEGGPPGGKAGKGIHLAGSTSVVSSKASVMVVWNSISAIFLATYLAAAAGSRGRRAGATFLSTLRSHLRTRYLVRVAVCSSGRFLLARSVAARCLAGHRARVLQDV